MKLYEIKLPARVYCECTDGSTFVMVDHLDGIYSFCILEKELGKERIDNPQHLSIFTTLEKYKDGYRILTSSPRSE